MGPAQVLVAGTKIVWAYCGVPFIFSLQKSQKAKTKNNTAAVLYYIIVEITKTPAYSQANIDKIHKHEYQPIMEDR